LTILCVDHRSGADKEEECPKSKSIRAKKLLAAKGVDVEEYDITMGGPQRAEMIERASGRSTVPQIFIGETHVGGSDDLAALERAGKLDALLEA
jgi:glutaredoxin 3